MRAEEDHAGRLDVSRLRRKALKCLQKLWGGFTWSHLHSQDLVFETATLRPHQIHIPYWPPAQFQCGGPG